ncbi:DNA excision repair protein ERCC-6 [Phytophthora pseudosyringae]|uniref:DNA excision repair protein ERCC-6 n=1 Tax=Phytophthora pseudosyringae TaxID=221518 RepID=A0A8T1VCR9_9STRA|nr:DNA excision repair protein ERCC-6 [Phytophthora pseudosyringae]
MARVSQFVTLVLRRPAPADAIPPLAELVTRFLGPSPNLSLQYACELGSTDLMDWIWACSSLFLLTPTPGWSLCSVLQSDKHYYQWQFSKCVEYAAKRGDTKLLTWLYGHFTECRVPQRAVRAAVGNGHLPVLQFLLKHDLGVDCTEDSGPTIKKKRVETDVRPRMKHASRDEFDHGDDAIEGVVREALGIGAIEFAESVVPEGTNVLDYAVDCKRVKVIERLVEGGYFEQNHFSAAGSIAKLARADRLDLTERISTQQNLPPDHSDFWGMDWLQALSTACQRGNMALLQWLVEHPMGMISSKGRYPLEED